MPEKAELKIKYNQLLEREENAELYIDDPARTPEEIAKWSPEYQKILTELNGLLFKIGSFTIKEVIYGFKIDVPNTVR